MRIASFASSRRGAERQQFQRHELGETDKIAGVVAGDADEITQAIGKSLESAARLHAVLHRHHAHT
ncbi:MAG: hypothetical protein IPO66_06780 [Rhodanobacteraceae bacterium]|nr:hypothetical protein [Rhodanobacteraceae bacterium]